MQNQQRESIYVFFLYRRDFHSPWNTTFSGHQRTEETNVISGSGQSAMQLLTAFLADHKEGILHIRDTLIPSSYEFFIKHCNEGADREIIRRRYEDAAQIIRKILDFGESNNEFRLNDDSANIAKFIMIFLEGLINTALSVGLDEEAVDNQIGIFIGILKMKLLK